MENKKLVPKLRFDFENSNFKKYKLGDLVENVVAGATPKTSVKEYWDGGDIPWLSSGEVHKKFVYSTDKFITSEGYNNASTKLVPKNSVLIALAGQGKTRGTVAINKIELCTNQSIASIIPNNNLYYKFLFYYLESKYDYLRALSSSDGGRGGLNLNLIRSIPIKIPLIDEQKLISNFINSIDKKISILERKYKSYEDFKKYLMQQIFAQELRFSGFDDEWKPYKIGDISKTYSGGTPSTSKREYYEGDIPFIRSGEINNYVTEQYINEDAIKNSSAKWVQKGDLLLALYGATSGEVAISKIDGAINQAVLKIDNDMDNYFQYNYFLKYKEQIIHKYLQGGQGNLSANIIKKLEFKYPSLDEQKKISQFLMSIDNKIELLEKKHQYYQDFKKGLIQQMFI